MSTLTLTVIRCPEPAATQRRRLQGGSLTLGRNEDCDWPLPDPLRSLSRKHCTIEFYGGVWQVRDQSANGTRINGEAEAVGNGLTRQLRDGDRLLLGDYEIEVRIEEAMATVAGPDGGTFGSPFSSPFGSAFGGADNPTGVFGHGAGQRGGGFSGGFGGVRLPGLDEPPSYRPFESQPRDAGVQSDHAAASAGAYMPRPLAEQPAKAIPDNWFDLEESQIRLRDVAPAAQPAPVPAAASEPTAEYTPAPASVRPAAGDVEPVDFSTPAPQQSTRDASGTAAATTAWPPPTASTPEPFAAAAAAPVAAPAGAHASGGDSMAAALAAFLQAGELPPDLVVRASANPEQALRSAGALLRTTVGGMRSLLIARGTVKRGFRIEQTMIRTRENNPLKFATSDEQALAALLDPRTAALDAVHEAISDLTGHQVAVMAATQAAARALLKELEPERLLAEDAGGGFFPGAQEKRLWEAYKRRHAQLIEQFEDDLKSAFGTAFARAYEDIVGRAKS